MAAYDSTADDMLTRDDAPKPAIIIYGDPVGGFFYIGPFPSVAAACAHGNTDGDLDDIGWWTAELEPVEAQA